MIILFEDLNNRSVASVGPVGPPDGPVRPSRPRWGPVGPGDEIRIGKEIGKLQQLQLLLQELLFSKPN